MDIDYLRQQIDDIDTQLTGLFVRRMELGGQIAGCKAEKGLNVLNKSREREILARVSELAGDEFDGYARVLYSTLFDLSRSYQHRLTDKPTQLADRIQTALETTPKLFPTKAVVACQGVEGAYSQQACDRIFSFANIMYFKNFEGVFNAVGKGLCQYGVLPIENSAHGSVNDVYDLMRNHDFHIVRSFRLHIDHCLLAKSGTSIGGITEIVSHEQAIGQCSEYLAKHPMVKVTVCENTAAAAKLVAESDRTDIAAISSPDCAGLYGLSVLESHIANTGNNYTRFIVISKDLEIYPGSDKISFMYAVGHTPGSLNHVLSRFSSMGLNMTKLESRPLQGTSFQYMFYTDIEASVYSEEVVKLLCSLESELEAFVFLGCYKEI